MIQRMLGPEKRPASEIARETGVSYQTVLLWRSQAASTMAGMAKRSLRSHTAQVQPQRRPEDWTAEERLRVVLEAGKLGDDELGELLRREGLHEATLEQWRAMALEGLSAGATAKSASQGSRRVRDLERQLRRKDKALAEAAALLVLQKKVQAIWGDEDDSTDPRSDE